MVCTRVDGVVGGAGGRCDSGGLGAAGGCGGIRRSRGAGVGSERRGSRFGGWTGPSFSSCRGRGGWTGREADQGEQEHVRQLRSSRRCHREGDMQRRQISIHAARSRGDRGKDAPFSLEKWRERCSRGLNIAIVCWKLSNHPGARGAAAWAF